MMRYDPAYFCEYTVSMTPMKHPDRPNQVLSIVTYFDKIVCLPREAIFLPLSLRGWLNEAILHNSG